jgi:inorganic pyrophosphatase
MNLDRVGSGRDLPNDFNVIIEIPMNADPIKYEVDKETGALFVDRFMMTSMHYPCNYGYIPHTIADDGDPVDVLVITPYPIAVGAVIRCRVLGVLKMTDEAGGDSKLLAVPIDKVLPIYSHWKKHDDLPTFRQSNPNRFDAYASLACASDRLDYAAFCLASPSFERLDLPSVEAIRGYGRWWR